MKKIAKIAALFLVFGLVACSGKAISRGEAIDILTSIVEKEEAGEIGNVDVFRVEQMVKIVEEQGTLKISQITAIDGKAKQVYSKQEMQVIADGENETSTTERWMYKKNNVIYDVSRNDDEKEYSISDEEEDLEFFNEMFENIDASVKSYYNSSGFTASLSLQYLNDLEEITAGSSTSISIVSESHKSKGPGHLISEIVLSSNDEEGEQTSPSSLKFTFTNYRLTFGEELTKSPFSSNGTMLSSVNLNYTRANISLPNITDYTLVE